MNEKPARYTDMNDKQLANALAKSGYFDDKKTSQSLTKILAGREMGFGPVTSLKNIHFVDGSIEVGGQLIASKIRQSDKYDYRIDEHTDEKCTITIVDSEGNDIGSVTWDMERAKKAGLSNKRNWQNYPRNMVFNRAISDARRFHCPDVMDVGPYTPGEIPTNGSAERAMNDAEESDIEDVKDADFEVTEADENEEPQSTDEDGGADTGEVEATSAARDLAEAHEIDLGEIEGSGEGGRVTKPDVKEFINERVEERSKRQLFEDIKDLREELDLPRDVILNTFHDLHNVDLREDSLEDIDKKRVEEVRNYLQCVKEGTKDLEIDENDALAHESLIPF